MSILSVICITCASMKQTDVESHMEAVARAYERCLGGASHLRM